jgi:hypothetical protein
VNPEIAPWHVTSEAAEISTAMPRLSSATFRLCGKIVDVEQPDRAQGLP